MEAVRTALTLEEAFKSLGIGRLDKKRGVRGVRGSNRERSVERDGTDYDGIDAPHEEETSRGRARGAPRAE